MSDFEKVAVFEDTIQLPTYALKGENPNPVFRSQYGVAHIYPYTLLDDIAAEPAEKTYRTLVLENRYLRVTVIPDLGGRVYSVFDKISNREVFYKNSVVKFSPLAIRGAFFSGGVEFSFPVAHAPTTTDPVNWVIRENEDGSASIVFGGLEHISRLRWMITLTLSPGRCALAQDVQLYNPYNLPGRYHYWTNASLDADDQTEFVYPLRRVRSYEFAGTASWPFSRLDLILDDPGLPGMEGVPMWPAERMRQPVNFRWQKNMLAQVSIFGRDVAWDFFGAWRHSVDHGYAHFADHRDVSGMKLWSWGNAGVGVVNQTALTDDGSLYAETQCGAMETQLDFAFLPPGKTRLWREWWLPLRGLGGLTCASAEAGARLHLSPSTEGAGKLELQVAVCPAHPLGEGRVEVTASGKTLLSEPAHLDPAEPWRASCSLSSTDLGSGPIRSLVTGPGGESVLDYTLDREPGSSLPEEADGPAAPGSSAAYYQLGLQHENFDNREQALEAYRNAIRLAPRNGEAHFRLALMLLRAADLSSAESHFRRARLNGLAGELLSRPPGILQEHPEIARRALAAVPVGSDLYPAALLAQGALALQKGDWQRAITMFKGAYPLESRPVSAGLLLGIALRRLGQLEEARQELQSVLALDPLNQPALHELALLDGGPYQATLLRLLNDDCQYFLDLAGFYIGAGLLEDALDVLEEAAQLWQYPLCSTWLLGSQAG
jgi:Flp pilus assembly protein TadD